MKILYQAKHNSGKNDDEGAIAWALEQLGHRVIRAPVGFPPVGPAFEGKTCDFYLYHHSTPDFDNIHIPTVSWCFDRIWEDDPSVKQRSEARLKWADFVTSKNLCSFFTDGDYVQNNHTGLTNIFQLSQGFDSRITERVAANSRNALIAHVGMSHKNGEKRLSFVRFMQDRYKDNFICIHNDYRENLIRRLNQVAIVVAPDSPVSDQYWSNRVYNITGMGAFLVHPDSKGLAWQYGQPGWMSIPTYRDRNELVEVVNRYLLESFEREVSASRAKLITNHLHTYKNRCEKLIKKVQEYLT
jgi:hypothetical protein